MLGCPAWENLTGLNFFESIFPVDYHPDYKTYNNQTQIFVVLSNLTFDSNGHLACKGFLHKVHNVSCSRNRLKEHQRPKAVEIMLAEKEVSQKPT